MATTVVGLYDHLSQAQQTVQDLIDAGFKRDEVSLVANASAKEYGEYFDDDGKHRADVHTDDELTREEGAASGAGIGATIGGLGGLLMGLGLLAVPGVGPALAAGPIVSALVGAGIGAAAGGITGALVNHGVDEEYAGYYAEGVRRGGSMVMLTVNDDRLSDVERLMNNHDPVDIEERVEAWKKTGFDSYSAEAEPYTVEEIHAERESMNIPIVQEELVVGKREVDKGGVRVRSYVRETPVQESVSLHEERVEVKRTPVDRKVDNADAAFKEQSVEMRETAEEVVVGKTARVVEEVTVEKTASDHTETVSDTVRRTEVEVEEIDTTVTSSSFDSDVTVFREHYNTNFVNSGRSFDYYSPAYRFGGRISREDNFKGMGWDKVEADAQRRWEERNPGTWNDYRDAVRYSYEQEIARA